MRGTMLTIPAQGPLTRENLSAPPDLAKLQKIVGGYIQAVPYLRSFVDDDGKAVRCVALCNQNGKRKKLPINTRANHIWTAAMVRETGGTVGADVLVGNIVPLFGDRAFMEAL